jgi:hypothetical protein
MKAIIFVFIVEIIRNDLNYMRKPILFFPHEVVIKISVLLTQIPIHRLSHNPEGVPAAMADVIPPLTIVQPLKD